MGTTHYFRVLQNRFGHERTRATLAVTAGGSWDAAGLKRAREAARTHAQGCGWTGGVAAVFRGGGAARLAERARARAGTWGLLVLGIREPRASHPLVSAPWPGRPVRKNTEAHFPPPQELRVRSWFLGSPRNVALKKNGVHLHNALFALCKFLSLNPEKLRLLPWCRFSLRSLLRHLRQWCASWGSCSNNCSGEL